MKKQAKYELIYQDLKQKILNGFFSDGRLPALAELTKCYDASLLTVNNAVKKLAEDGLVSRSSGRSGTRIEQPGLRHISMQSQTINTWNDTLQFTHKQRINLHYLTARHSSFIPDEISSLIKNFERRYPWIHVVQDYTDDMDFLKMSNHDLIQGSHSALLPLIARKKLLDLEPYFQEFGRANTILHDRYTAPLMMTLPLLYYRKESQADVPENWDEFFRLNQKLKQEGKYSASLLGFVSLLYFFIGNISQNLTNPKKEPQLCQAIQLLHDYYSWDAPWNTLSPQSIISVALKQNISFYIGYYCNIYRHLSKDYDYTLLPFPEKYLIETIRIGINAETLHPTESWLFLNYLRSAEVQRHIVKTSFGIPYQAEVFHNEFRKASPKLYKLLLPLLDKLEESYVAEETREMIYHVVYPLLEQYFSREFTMDECVRSLRSAMGELLKLDSIQTRIR
ncbi:MAG: extracellular solute-binding protein [Lentisphaeria bacterium]|nr:extracellular solute-binding protein [Lentisphaeria bacterium]